MTLRFIEGWDAESTAGQPGKWDPGANWGALSGWGAGRFAGGPAAPSQSVLSGGGVKTLDAQPTWIVGLGVNVTGAAIDGNRFLAIEDGANVQASLWWMRPAAAQQVRLQNTVGAQLYQADLAPGWHYLELKVQCSNPGAYTFRIDEVVVATGNSNFQGGASATGDRVDVAAFKPLDDLYVCDNTGPPNNDLLGDSRVETVLPNGAGDATQWTPSAAPNWSDVDDAAPNDDADYVSSATVGLIDTYALGDLPSVAGLIRGVQLAAWCRKTDAGARSINLRGVSGATPFEIGPFALAATYQYALAAPRETDPNTGLAWTIAAVNALLAGQKVAV